MAGQHETVPLSRTADRVCAANTPCAEFYHETVAPTATSDRVCARDTVCNRLDYMVTEATATSDRVCSCQWPDDSAYYTNVTIQIVLENLDPSVLSLTPLQMQQELEVLVDSLYQSFRELLLNGLRDGSLAELPTPEAQNVDGFLNAPLLEQVDKYVRECGITLLSVSSLRDTGDTGGQRRRRADLQLAPDSLVELSVSTPRATVGDTACLYYAAGDRGHVLTRLRNQSPNQLYGRAALTQGAVQSSNGCECGCPKESTTVKWLVPLIVGLLLLLMAVILLVYRARRQAAEPVLRAPTSLYIRPPKRLPAYIAPPTYDQSAPAPIRAQGPPRSTWAPPKAPPYRPPPAYPGRRDARGLPASDPGLPRYEAPPGYIRALQLKAQQPRLRTLDPRPHIYQVPADQSPATASPPESSSLGKRTAPAYEDPPAFPWDSTGSASRPAPAYADPPDFSALSSDAEDERPRSRPAPAYEAPPSIDFDDDDDDDGGATINGSSAGSRRASRPAPAYESAPSLSDPDGDDDADDDNDDDDDARGPGGRRVPGYTSPPAVDF